MTLYPAVIPRVPRPSHRGSYLAGPQLMRRLAQYLIRLPSDVVGVRANLAHDACARWRQARADPPPDQHRHVPGNRFIQATKRIPIAPGVIAHSIISVNDDRFLAEASDRVLKNETAHTDGVKSELVW